MVPLWLPAKSKRNLLSEMPCTAAAVVPWKSQCSCEASSNSPRTLPNDSWPNVEVSTAGCNSAPLLARPCKRVRSASKAIQAALFSTRTTSVTSRRKGISRPLRSLVDLETKEWSTSCWTMDLISSGKDCLLTKRRLVAMAFTSQLSGKLATSLAAMADLTAAPQSCARTSEEARSTKEASSLPKALKRKVTSEPRVVTSASSANLKALSGGCPERASFPGGQ
mmetsp:Transcript_77168/g.213308  ORF Transcript_77168/g.213308 Transcript_77168/m.213308 type:complete len:223 (+) Transcript_77168:720-1388(+)